MSVMETFIKTLVKSIDIPTLLAHPKIVELTTLGKQILADYKEVKETLRRINDRLDRMDATHALFNTPLRNGAGIDLTQIEKDIRHGRNPHGIE